MRDAVAGGLCLLLSGCAFDLAHVPQQPTTIVADSQVHAPIMLRQDADLRLAYGYTRKLRAGSHWTYVLRITQGDVYRSPDQVLTVEASNIHEAYIVVRDAVVVGFYLPVEKTFTPLDPTVALSVAGA
ncbi:MAG: hypothetical protein JSR18_09340 [Proteobacteria bacterium]|nr:hypothetical protein [Pseudomonadota bacterium]